MIAYGQDTTLCLTRSDVITDNMAYMDAFAYRAAYDSTASVCEDQKQAISNLEITVLQAEKTIQTKDETTAFYKSQAEMRVAENRKLERSNQFWRIYGGLMTFVAGVSILTILK